MHPANQVPSLYTSETFARVVFGVFVAAMLLAAGVLP